jgi:hypothetical protein
MSIFRSYFKKNNTVIQGNYTNNSQNPVAEISYGTSEKQMSRFIFDINLDNLLKNIQDRGLELNKINKHILHLTNTISTATEYVGKVSYSAEIQRASSFDLDLYAINEEWDEGSGYDFIYNNIVISTAEQASNWYNSKTDKPWLNEGSYVSGVTEIIGTQHFDKGCENIEIDITEHVNKILSGATSYGFGLKFSDNYENLITNLRNAVAFHTKNTNTVYEPYLETIIDDEIYDNRKCFFLDENNELYLYLDKKYLNKNVIVNFVDINDFNGNLYKRIDSEDIIKVENGIYKIAINISSDDYPDNIIFNDIWDLSVNDKNLKYVNDFYILSNNVVDEYYNPDNYHLSFKGLLDGESISTFENRKVVVDFKCLYPDGNALLLNNVEYRIFYRVGSKYEIDVIPFSKLNRTDKYYFFKLDTSWLIPQEYYIQLRYITNDIITTKTEKSFNIVSNKIYFE